MMRCLLSPIKLCFMYEGTGNERRRCQAHFTNRLLEFEDIHYMMKYNKCFRGLLFISGIHKISSYLNRPCGPSSSRPGTLKRVRAHVCAFRDCSSRLGAFKLYSNDLLVCLILPTLLAEALSTQCAAMVQGIS